MLESIAVNGGKERRMEPRDISEFEGEENIVAKKLIEALNEKNPDEEKSFNLFDKKLFLIRDPRDSFISRLLYMPYKKSQFNDDNAASRYTSIIKQKSLQPKSIDLRSIESLFYEITGINVSSMVKDLNAKSIRLWREYNPDFFLIKYEDFVSGNVDSIVKYLGFNISSSVEVPKNFKRLSRTRSYGNWKNWFTEEDNEFYFNEFKDFILEFSYLNEPINTEQIIDRQHADLYVINVINDGRRRLKVPAFEVKTF